MVGLVLPTVKEVLLVEVGTVELREGTECSEVGYLPDLALTQMTLNIVNYHSCT